MAWSERRSSRYRARFAAYPDTGLGLKSRGPVTLRRGIISICQLSRVPRRGSGRYLDLLGLLL